MYNSQSYPQVLRKPVQLAANKGDMYGELICGDGTGPLHFTIEFFVNPQLEVWSKFEKDNPQSCFLVPDLRPGNLHIQGTDIEIPLQSERQDRAVAPLETLLCDRMGDRPWVDRPPQEHDAEQLERIQSTTGKKGNRMRFDQSGDKRKKEWRRKCRRASEEMIYDMLVPFTQEYHEIETPEAVERSAPLALG